MTEEPAAEPPVRESGPVEEEAVEVEDPLAAASRERDEYLDALQRLKAEFENYRKRTLRDQDSLVERANERLVKELLPVLDDLGRALAHDGPELEEGVGLVHRELVRVLGKEGLAEIEADGRFDPHVHEALLAQPSADHAEGSVLEVIQKGYRLGDRVLRPTRVIVSE